MGEVTGEINGIDKGRVIMRVKRGHATLEYCMCSVINIEDALPALLLALEHPENLVDRGLPFHPVLLEVR